MYVLQLIIYLILHFSQLTSAEPLPSLAHRQGPRSHYTSQHKNLTTITILHPDTRHPRNIAYFVNQHGQAIVDDDILFGPEEYLLSFQAGSPALRKRWYGTKTPYAWPDGIIHYKYESDAVEANHSGPMNEALALWREYAPYITIIKDPNSPKMLKKDVVTITSIRDGCYSNVALASGGKSDLQMNFDPDWDRTGRQYRHEWGHQLGLMHEHSHPDREKWVHFHCDALAAHVQDGCTEPRATNINCCTAAADPCCDLLHNFDNSVYPQYQWTTYNPESVMHYSGDAFAKPGMETLTRVDGSGPVIENPDITQGDVNGVCKIYDYLCDAWASTAALSGLKKTSGWTFRVRNADFSSWSLDPAPNSKFVTLKGKRMVNTKCLSVLETTSNALKLVSVGANFMFETLRDDQELPPDHCCINLYEDNACGTAPFERICRSTPYDASLKKDLQSWRVWNCTGLWTGVLE
ncbi:hypothetical protein BCR34DRAFT_593256 [Clohesyomyces aquaticus]|uniref:Peptidase M12A domain-containing protein n=1 Tax=Clohesyomyces aquaticus TaxID=1231657 RepID=A0A1Y1YK13_9PLEO|nr:hypothetical protein BCR34DRAFT_593256 [Clohesyomyces aquaticus]